MPALREIIEVLDQWFPPRWAESWDAVGLTCGDPGEAVERVLLAVDPVPATVDEAIGQGAGLLLTHHPLLLTGVHGVPADDPKGALVHRMIRAGVAHFAAHTNADVADPGVSDALARVLGLTALRPIEPTPDDPRDKLVTFVPAAQVHQVIDALTGAGAGGIGDYDRCAWTVEGIGTFRPGAEARPTVGRPGQIEQVAETRVEMVLPRRRRAQVLRALLQAHPYEEVAWDLYEQAALPGPRGLGRIGELPAAMSLRGFARRAAGLLPQTVWGMRAAGDPDRLLRTVAVCGGSGGSLAENARRLGADVLLTADLKHHATLEETAERAAHGMALVDAAHWATEAPWLNEVAERLREHFGAGLRVTVSTKVTDPWTLHVPPTESSRIE